ncbi:MAG: cell division protein FtsK [Pseudonocardia sp.]|nr:cell division protein FtsK [Pseudonocardia sp.]
MVRGRTRRQQEISAAFDNLCAAIGRALGAADGAQDAADHARATAMAELWLREDGLAAARSDPVMARVLAPGHRHLAELVGRVAADEDAVLGTWLADGPDELDGVVGDAAPGPAGRPPAEWLGGFGKIEGVGDAPGLWRIGAGRIGAGRAPFGVAVPLLDEAHLQITADPDRRHEAEALVENLLMRVLSYFRPGLVHVHVWDTGQVAGALPGLYPLTRTDLLTVHHPGRLEALLDHLSDRIRRIRTRLLVDGHPSLRALGAATGTRHEPWTLAVLMGDHQPLPAEEYAQLQRVARGGPACGIQLVLVDVPMRADPGTETVTLRGRTTRSSMTGPHVAVELDPPLPAREVTAACQAISEEHEAWRDRVSAFRDLLPQKDWGARSSRTGLRASVGFAGVLPVDITLADGSPHALIGGPSGSGKTNLLLTMIGSLAAHYPPKELVFYLLDFKEGVSFAQFAPGHKDRTWLPHARLVGVNINTDREFGLALLQFLADEMRRRSEIAKAHEVTKLAELRAADPEGEWPRIVAVIDEFQFLFNERDAVTRAAIALLEDIARRGRSQGIHLVLASQDVSGIEAFWGRSAIFEQFVLRIALPRARKVLAELNEAAIDLPRWHAVVNHESGIRQGNEIVRIPDATAKGTLDEVQRVVHGAYAEEGTEPRLFDGSRAPRVADLLADLPASDVPHALVGQCIDVAGTPAAMPLPDAPGRNLGVLGSDPRDAVRVLDAAAVSILRAFRPGAVDVVVAPLVDAASADELCRSATSAGHEPEVVDLARISARLHTLAEEVTARQQGAQRRPTFVVLYGADAADALLGRSGTEALQKVLRFGPEVGVHVLGWWRSVTRLRNLLSINASPDDLGAWVALDVQGHDLGTLVPSFGVDWSSRPGRGLFFDRGQHSEPRVVIVPEAGPT